MFYCTQTEWVPSGSNITVEVSKYWASDLVAPRFRAWGNGLIQVLDIKIHMGHLLLSALFPGPDRRDIIFHFLKSQNPPLMRAQPRPSITGEHLLPSKQFHIKIR